jgi:hypothetical protein
MNIFTDDKGIIAKENLPNLLLVFPTTASNFPATSVWIFGPHRYWTKRFPGKIMPIAATVFALIVPTT